MERKTKITTFKVEMVCDKCKKGTMIPKYPELNSMLVNIVPSTLHRCTNCGAEEEFIGIYPKIEYEEE